MSSFMDWRLWESVQVVLESITDPSVRRQVDHAQCASADDSGLPPVSAKPLTALFLNIN